MTRIRLNDAVASELRKAPGPVELVDEAGALVGRFTPFEPCISEEEIERRLREGGGRTLKEILADLEKRA